VYARYIRTYKRAFVFPHNVNVFTATVGLIFSFHILIKSVCQKLRATIALKAYKWFADVVNIDGRRPTEIWWFLFLQSKLVYTAIRSQHNTPLWFKSKLVDTAKYNTDLNIWTLYLHLTFRFVRISWYLAHGKKNRQYHY